MNSILIRTIGIEFTKHRRTALYWFITVTPLIVPVLTTFAMLLKGPEYVPDPEGAWEWFLQRNFGGALNLLYPLYIIILTLLINGIDHKNSTWKMLLTSPVSFKVQYIGKFLYSLILSIISILLFGIFLLLGGMIINMVNPDLGFGKPVNSSWLFQSLVFIWIATLGMHSLQFWLSFRWPGILKPVTIGIAGFISFMLSGGNFDYSFLHPFGWHIFAQNFVLREEILWYPVIYSAAFSLVILVAGYGDSQSQIIK